MKNAFNKEIIRSITQSIGRFAAIAIISFLGAGVYSGLRMAAPDMRINGDDFFDGTNTYDIAVVSELGIDEDVVAALRAIEGVGDVMPTYKADAMVMVDDNSYAASLESLPVRAARASDTSDGVHALSGEADYLNRPILVEGAWPQAGTDCVVGVDAAQELGISVGTKLEVQEKASHDGDDGDDGDEDDPTFRKTKLTVTGLVNSPLYCSSSMLGPTSLATGELDLYLYVPPGVFNRDLPYSIAYATVPAATAKTWDTEPYEQAVKEVKRRVQEQAPAIADMRYTAVVEEAQKELDDAQDEYLEERADAVQELADAKEELDDAHEDLSDAHEKLSDGREDVLKGYDDLVSARRKLMKAYNELTTARNKLIASRKQLDGAREELKKNREKIEQMRQAIAAGYLQGPEALAQYEYARGEYEKGLAKYEKGVAAYEKGLKQYEKGVAEYKAGKEKYEKGIRSFKSGVTDFREGAAEYEDGVGEYEDGKAEYEDGVAEAQEEFADAEAELADAQAEIDDIEHPEVYVIDRSKNAGAASLSSDSEGITQIALFIPFMFFLVAALVSLTSMTRMVDEERMNIGTHKALGYGKARITSKYLIYAALASGVGSVAGTIALGKLLPWFILVSYGISYAVPVYATPIQADLALRAIGLSVGVTLFATWGAAASTLRSRPAALMLPRAPKAGKRIILERIGPLWRRFSFSHKVTARNLLRYKRRFFMAVIGIAGCTALLMIGFGLRDAIGGIISNQYEELVHYDAIVRTDDEMSGKGKAALERSLAEQDVASLLQIDDFNLIAEGNDDELRIEVVVPAEPQSLSDFVTLRNRKTGEELPFENDQIILTEKAAETLGVDIGDSVQLFDENDVGDKTGDPHSFIVGGISENYLGHYAFLTPDEFTSTFGEQPVFDMFYVKLAQDADANAFSARLLDLDGVDTVSFVADKISTYEDMLDVMNKLIYVVMLLSAALAFVVLYNLTNINITERVREIATLKVLGFTRGEVNAYIFREILVMSLIGALCGCILGVPLTFYIAQAAETANMMFGRSIEPASFAISFLLTMVFTVIVALTMRGKLSRVNMVESLKSVE